MPITYDKIATTTLGSAGVITFTSIPGTYTDLVLVLSATPSSFASVKVRFNSDSGTNYSVIVMNGNGSSAESSTATSATEMNLGLLGTDQSTSIINIFNYSNTTTYKTSIGRGNTVANLVRAAAGLWRNTAAINSISLVDSMPIGTMATLYGIKAA